MALNLSNLELTPAQSCLDLLADPVAEALTSNSHAAATKVIEIDPAFSDTAAFCEHYHVDSTHVANCVILQAKRAERVWFAACVVLGSTRADVNGLIRRTLDARTVSFAAMDQAVAATCMEYGGITPVGLPPDWPLLVDKAVTAKDFLIIGSGKRNSKLVVSGTFFTTLPNTRILESIGK